MKKIKEIYSKICISLLPVKKLFRVCFKVARLLTIIVLGTIFVTIFLTERSTIEVQSTIHKDYERTIIDNVYTDDLSNSENLEKIKNVLNDLPKPLMDEIEENWIILISKEPCLETFENAEGTMGITYYKYNVIWMQSDFSEKQFLHECGHVFDFLCGEIHRTKDFETIYRDNWQYLEKDKEEPDAHCVSDASEFWAEMFAEYFTNPDYMKENFSTGYSYFDKIVSETWRFTFLGKYHGYANRLFLVVGDKFSNLIQTPVNAIKFNANKVSTIFHKKIDIHNYNYKFDYNFKCDISNSVYNSVLDVIEHPDNYPENVTLYFDADATYESYINSQHVLQTYFVTTETLLSTGCEYSTINGLQTTISFNKQKILNLEQSRRDSLNNIQNILSTFKDGSETNKLLQISACIMEHSVPQNTNTTMNSDDFWNEGQTNSLINSMVFKQFCDYIGVKCDILFTPLPTNVEHYFNSVTLINKSVCYYDVSDSHAGLINVENYNKIIYGHY